MNPELSFYWKLMLRRLPVMMFLFLIFAGGAIAVAYRLPTVYQTSAQLLVEPPQITDFGQAATSSAAEQLEIIQQRLMTRANLIDTANQFLVFGRNHGMNPDQVVAEMRARTRISRVSGRDRATLMSISFEDDSPQTVASVVNRYVTLVLEENVRLNTRRAESNLDFFEQEVVRLGAELDQQSQKILVFQNQNADALPDGLNYRLNRQSQLQERVARGEREIASLRDQRASVIRIYETTGRLEAAPQAQLSPQERQLAGLRNELNSMLAVYSETNPRVRALRAQIVQLETAVAAAAPGGGVDDAGAQKSLLDVTVAQIDAKISSVETEMDDVNRDLEKLRTQIERTPANGIALSALQRTYDNLQGQYNQAIARLNTARMEERVVASAKGQRITVIEQATVPNQPARPNRPMIAGAGIVAGLASAVGLFLLLELVNRSVRRPAELVSRLGVTPLATIPYMEGGRRRFIRRTLQVASLVVVVVGVPALLWAVDRYYLPLDLLVSRAIERIGL